MNLQDLSVFLSVHVLAVFVSAGVNDTPYTLQPLDGADGFAAEIVGLNINEVKAGKDDDLIKKIKSDLSKHGLLVLKNQGLLSNSELRNITGWWGELNCNGPIDSQDRCVFRNTNGPGTRIWSDRGRMWHIDSSHKEKIDHVIVYHVPDEPPEGATLVLPLSKCVDILTPEEREKYEGLWYITHRGIKKSMLVVHPENELVVFRPHFFPMKSFIWNYGTDEEMEVTDRQKIQVINYNLFKHIDVNCKPMAYPVVWEKGDVAFLDNMWMTHKAAEDVPKDPVKDDPNVLLRVSAYSPITREAARGYVPKAQRPKTQEATRDEL